MAVETLGRVLHPRGLIEAENYSAASGTPTTEPNNEWGVGGIDRPNGGSSVTGLVSNDWLQWNVLPPEPVLGPPASNAYNYTLLVRAGNISPTLTSVPANVTVYNAGTSIWTGTISISYTGDKHEYVVASTSPSFTIPLSSGVQYTIKLLFQGGPCSVDDLVLVSGGVMQ